VKPDFEEILDLKKQSFLIKKVVRKNRLSLSAAWHYHPEIEICYTKKSTGKRYVGNHISKYEEGDLVLFGSYLPHGFTTTEKTNQTVLQFREDFLVQPTRPLEELSELKLLFKKAKRGLEIKGNTKIKVIKIIKRLKIKKGLKRYILFLKLLSLLEKSDEFIPICNSKYASTITITQLGRMKVIFEYLESNYLKDITISDAAAIINLTDSAFYKFIKRHTKKKFTQILNEYRIEHATKKLINTNMTIAEVCFDAGFKNLSYFNRRFKDVQQLTPSQYREQFVG
jgi:AraC-like DNA-binding protein